MTSKVSQSQDQSCAAPSRESHVAGVCEPVEGEIRAFQLRYSIGDACLFRASFPAFLEHAPFGADVETGAISLPAAVPRGVALSGVRGVRISERMPSLRLSRRGIVYVQNQTVNYYVDLRGTYAEYWNGFSSKTRSTLSRKVRKLAALPDADMQCRVFRGLADVDEFHSLSRRIAVNTYQEKLFNGAIPAGAEFVAKLRNLAAAGRFRGFVLFVKAEPVAYLYLPVAGGILTYGYLGYEPAYGEWSPGTVLLQMALESVFAEGGFRYFDFTYGESPTKQLFGRQKFLRADIYLFRWSLRNCFLLGSHIALDWCSKTLGRLLGAVGIRNTVRRLIRRSAAA